MDLNKLQNYFYLKITNNYIMILIVSMILCKIIIIKISLCFYFGVEKEVGKYEFLCYCSEKINGKWIFRYMLFWLFRYKVFCETLGNTQGNSSLLSKYRSIAYANRNFDWRVLRFFISPLSYFHSTSKVFNISSHTHIHTHVLSSFFSLFFVSLRKFRLSPTK